MKTIFFTLFSFFVLFCSYNILVYKTTTLVTTLAEFQFFTCCIVTCQALSSDTLGHSVSHRETVFMSVTTVLRIFSENCLVQLIETGHFQ